MFCVVGVKVNFQENKVTFKHNILSCNLQKYEATVKCNAVKCNFSGSFTYSFFA